MSFPAKEKEVTHARGAGSVGAAKRFCFSHARFMMQAWVSAKLAVLLRQEK